MTELDGLKKEQIFEKYPFLVMRTPWDGHVIEDTEITEYDNCPVGWREIFLDVIKVISSSYDNWTKKQKQDFYFTDIKEKFGALRIYTSFSTDKISNAIEYAETTSAYTCIECGAQPQTKKNRIIWQTRGYILPFCKDCMMRKIYEKDSHFIKDDFVKITRRKSSFKEI